MVQVIDRHEVAIGHPMDRGEGRCVELTPEPVPLGVGHVSDQTEQRERRWLDGTRLQLLLVQAGALDQQGVAMEVEPDAQLRAFVALTGGSARWTSGIATLPQHREP